MEITECQIDFYTVYYRFIFSNCSSSEKLMPKVWKMHFLINYIKIKFVWIISTFCNFQDNLCSNLDSCKLFKIV